VNGFRFLDLRPSEWGIALLAAAGAVGGVSIGPVPLDGWSAAGIGLTTIIFVHMCLRSDRYVVFPDLVALAACLQWVVAPWLSPSYPPHLPMFRMVLPAPEYLRYALPATAALWIGLQLPIGRVAAGVAPTGHPAPLSRRVRYLLDVTLAVGLVVNAYLDLLPPSLTFLGYLIAGFRFFAALGWLVTRTPGWWIRVVVVLAQLTAEQSFGGGIFYLVVHWGGYFLLVYAFMRRWRWQLAVALLAGCVAVGTLQEVKETFRKELVLQQPSGPAESLRMLGDLMWKRVSGEPVAGGTTDFNDSLVRFNQGWIIARVMLHVPFIQPYAGGSTIRDAIVYSIVPRFLVDKPEGASQSFFRTYTGVELGPNTSMGLGIIGEMYANFGATGGVAATFVYGLVLGGLFAWFAARARDNPLWWAAASIVVLPGIEPGFNLADILNHVVKAAIVLAGVIWAVPAIRQLLAPTGPARADTGSTMSVVESTS
jgi:hypothetical protein